jgi:hypothetical protein
VANLTGLIASNIAPNYPTLDRILLELRPLVYVELGVGEGGCLAHVARIVRAWDGQAIGVDDWRGPPYKVRETAYRQIAGLHNARIIEEDTADAAGMIPWGSVGVLLIDAGHRYQQVALDYALWRDRVKPGGAILFHDAHILAAGCEVMRFLRDLGGEQELDRNGCGLAVLRV